MLTDMPSAMQATVAHLKSEILRLQSHSETEATGGTKALSPGFEAMSELLPGGGFPFGRVIELVGSPGTGKNSLALLALAQATRQGEWTAYVEGEQETGLYPPAAQSLGLELDHLIWIRTSNLSQALNASIGLARSGAVRAIVLKLSDEKPPAGPWSRRLLEAAEVGRSVIFLLVDRPSIFDASLRIQIEPHGHEEVELTLTRSRLGPSGKKTRGILPTCPNDF